MVEFFTNLKIINKIIIKKKMIPDLQCLEFKPSHHQICTIILVSVHIKTDFFIIRNKKNKIQRHKDHHFKCYAHATKLRTISFLKCSFG